MTIASPESHVAMPGHQPKADRGGSENRSSPFALGSMTYLGIPARLVLLIAGLQACLLPGPLGAQPNPPPPAWLLVPYPTPGYFDALSSFHRGRYREALKAFAAEERSSPLVTIQSPHWIDAICYETMCGECCYELGNLEAGMQHYAAAIKLFLAFPDWMNQVAAWPVGPAGPGAQRLPWGASVRGAARASYRDPLSILVPKLAVSSATSDLARNSEASLQLHAREIVRSTVLAIRRRAMLLGPAARQDVLIGQVVAVLARRPAPPGPWPQAWIDLELGAAQAAAGRQSEAAATLQRAVLAGGRFDHPLTGIALVELGLLSIAQGRWEEAARQFTEATYAAAQWEDAGNLEEAFRWGTIAHMVCNRKDLYPPLLPALAWANCPRLRQLQVSLALSAAENHAILDETRQAAAMLQNARAAATADMGASRIAARLNHVAAIVLLEQQRSREAEAALGSAMQFMRKGSVWLFQMAMVDSRCTGVSALTGAHDALEMYARVLRDPQATDWAIDPLESLAALAAPHAGPLEHWLETAIGRKDYRLAVEIADRLRRHRFYASLPYGGRLVALRWLLESPETALRRPWQLARQELLAQHPEYEPLARQSQKLVAALQGQPMATGVEDRQQARQLEELSSVSSQQETVLCEIALGRDATEMVFPPLRSAREIQDCLPGRHALLAFLCTHRALYGFVVERERCHLWQVESPQRVGLQVMALLRQVNACEHSREMTLKDLGDPRWKATARDLLATLLEGSRLDVSALDELVVIPDGLLWYVPFEALMDEREGKSQPLVWRLRVRTVPTVSLAIGDAPKSRPLPRTAVAVGKLWQQADDSLGQEALTQLARFLPGTSALPAPLPGPACCCATMLDRLIVLDQVSFGEENPYMWSLLGRTWGRGGTVGDWMRMPWPRPQVVVLSSLPAITEKGLKRAGAAAGQEVFLLACGLMASGARTVLVPRWPTGGRSHCDLVREFVQELPYASAAEAWQRSVLLSAHGRLDPAAEPRLKVTDDGSPRASHPFFWAGYLLIDNAGQPSRR